MEKPTGDDPVILKQLTARIDRGGQPALELKTGSYRFGNTGENRIGELKCSSPRAARIGFQRISRRRDAVRRGQGKAFGGRFAGP